MKVYSCLLIALLLGSCSGGDKASNTGKSGFFSIGFENALENKKEYNLSEIAEDIQYIPLETNDSCLLRRVVDYEFTDDLILVRNFDHILLFKRDGKFIKRIGKSGKGPGEIDLIRIMSVFPEQKQIVVQLNWKRELYYFDFNGNLIKSFDFKVPISRIKALPDGRFIFHDSGAGGNEKFLFALISENLDTLSVIPNYQKWENKTGMIISIGYPDFDEFTGSAEKLFIKSMYNDTVYTIADNKLKPAYFIDLGKFMLPPDLRPEKLGVNGIQQFRDNGSKYCRAVSFASPGRVFLAAHSYEDEIPTRYILYDESLHKGTYLTEKNESAKGFLNDMDGIIDFWPTGSINEKQVYMPVSVMDLKKKINEGTVRPVKNPQKQEEIKKMIMSMEETDNPVLVVVTLKR